MKIKSLIRIAITLYCLMIMSTWQEHLFYFLLSLKVFYIQAFVIVMLLGKMMRKVFFGQLRAAEMEVSNLCTFLVF